LWWHNIDKPISKRDIGRNNRTGINIERRICIADISDNLSGMDSNIKDRNFTAATDNIILCNATSGAITITLPAAASNTNKIYSIKKTDGTAILLQLMEMHLRQLMMH